MHCWPLFIDVRKRNSIHKTVRIMPIVQCLMGKNKSSKAKEQHAEKRAERAIVPRKRPRANGATWGNVRVSLGQLGKLSFLERIVVILPWTFYSAEIIVPTHQAHCRLLFATINRKEEGHSRIAEKEKEKKGKAERRRGNAMGKKANEHS